MLRAPGLGFHAFAVSATLILLTALLGARAWSVGRLHASEVSGLVLHGLRSQELLDKIESSASALAQARRKLRITHDALYASVVSRHRDALEDASKELRDELQAVYPDLAPLAGEKLRSELAKRHRDRLQRAEDEARGLLRVIAAALALSFAATAWVLLLFFRGLVEPLRELDGATARIRGGELSHRVPAGRGVRELRDLAGSFNSMAVRLEALDHAKNEFLATISHEIRNPLAALKEGLSLIVAQGEALAPQARAKAGAACVIASKRLESMINNLLAHSRMEHGLYSFDFTPKNLAGTIRMAMDEVRPLAERRGMSVRYSGPAELHASFNWDGMVQVFENLLLNAIKYGEAGTPIEVTASAREGSAPVPEIQIAVINSGEAIAVGEVEKIFERFYRGANSSQQRGMGLGLHVVSRIVEAHRGRVTAASSEGRTRFELRFPGRYETEAFA